MVAGINNSRIFDTHYNSKDGKSRLYLTGFFYACKSTILGFVPPCNFIMKLLSFGCNATGKAKPFFIFALYQIKNSVMHYTEKKKTLRNKSTRVSPRLTLTGVKNPYVYTIRKAFLEFLEEERLNHCFAELRLKRKIEFAKELFPHERSELFKNHLKN